MNIKGKNALEGCPKCGRDLEYKRDTHESSLGYREPVDEIWECSKCQAEFRIARKPIIVEEVSSNFDPKQLLDKTLKKDLTLINQADDLEVWLYDKVIENKNEGLKYQLAYVFRFEDEDYTNCWSEIHMLALDPEPELLNKAKYLVGLEHLENTEIREKKENMFSLLIDANYSYMYFEESFNDINDPISIRKEKLAETLNQIVDKVKRSFNPKELLKQERS